jgi:hypothetical protein
MQEAPITLPHEEGSLAGEEAVAVLAELFETAVDDRTGILVPRLVSDVFGGEELSEVFGGEVAAALQMFAQWYADPKRKSYLGLGRPDLLAMGKGKEQVRQALKALARRIVKEPRSGVSGVLSAVRVDERALREAIGAWVTVRAIRVRDIDDQDQGRLGIPSL